MDSRTGFVTLALLYSFACLSSFLGCDPQQSPPSRRALSSTQLPHRLTRPLAAAALARPSAGSSGRAPSGESSSRGQTEPPHPSTDIFELLPPEPPPQWVACDERGFVHLSRQGFRAYRSVDFKLLADVRLPGLSNVVALAGGTYLLLGNKGVYRYYHGQTRPRAFARVPQIGPGELLPNPQDVNQFWLRYARDDALHLYNLDQEAAAADRLLDEQLGLAPRHIGLTLGQPRSLPGLTGGPFTFLADGDAFYAVPGGLRRVGKSTKREFPIPMRGTILHLLPDHRLDRYLAVNGEGMLQQMEMSRGHPQRGSLALGGLPYGVTTRAGVVAAVVLKQGSGRPRAWSLKVFRDFKLAATWRLRDEPGLTGDWVHRVTADRDLCLFPNKPWLLLGGRGGATVYDYAAGKRRFSTLPE